MGLTIDLPPEMERRLRQVAARRGLKTADYILQLLERELPVTGLTTKALLALPPQQRGGVLRAAAEDAAPLYEADLSLPPHERELTAFTALDGEEFYDANA